MHCIKFCIALLLICTKLYPAGNNAIDLKELDKAIENRDDYQKIKYNRINELSAKLADPEIKGNAYALFNVYNKLYVEYESFIYDSAFKYVEKTKLTAIRLQDNSKIAYAKIHLGFVLLSSGLFKEALDSVKSIRIHSLPDTTKLEYYKVIARIYYDLADYSRNSNFEPIYRSIGNSYQDSAMHFTTKNSSEYWDCKSLREMKEMDYSSAIQAFETWMNNFKLNDHQIAIATSSLGYIYSLLGNNDKAIEFLIKASIADIKASTKETVALRNLSNLLFQKGDTKAAYQYIILALDDATFYNARHRKIEIASILPIIEGERLSIIAHQRHQLIQYAILVTTLSLLVIIFTLIIFSQLNRLKKVRKILQDTNGNLQEINSDLFEANVIKEEYIGNIFSENSEFIEKIDAFQKTIHRKIAARQFDDLADIIKNSEIRRERENLFISFDKVFLKLFPHFVEEFNALFKSEDRIMLKKDELLNTDLRIFALMRLGIKDNEKIAKFLNYSINTIYTYKTNIKNKSIVPNEEFETKVMEIKSVKH